MIKLIGATLLVVSTGIAAQERTNDRWIEVTESESGDVVSIDVRSLTFSGSTVKFWTKSQGKGDQQVKSYWEADCVIHKIRNLEQVQYSGGKVKASFTTPDPWAQVIPDTVGEDIFRTACATRELILRNQGN